MTPAMATALLNRSLGDSIPLMMQFPTAGQVITWSASNPITDSAAAGTALATGHKTRNSMLGMDADTIPVTSLASWLKDLGYGVGIVTNVAADDATPGAFYAHVPNRKLPVDIDTQFANSGIDFLAGATLKGLKDKKGNPTGAAKALSCKGVYTAMGLGQLDSLVNALNAPRILLLEPDPFNDSNAGYSIDRSQFPHRMQLPDMTRAALNHLLRVSPEKFMMMVEGGNIDHALHANDAATALHAVREFNDALALAYGFLRQHPDETLIVVTADHDTGGMVIGTEATRYNAWPEVLNAQKLSKAAFSDIANGWLALLNDGKPFSWNDAAGQLENLFGFGTAVALTEAEWNELEQEYHNVFDLKEGETQRTLYDWFNPFAVKVVDMVSRKAGIGWTTTHHSGSFVPVYAAGNGHAAFGRTLDNTEIPRIIYNIVLDTLPSE